LFFHCFHICEFLRNEAASGLHFLRQSSQVEKWGKVENEKSAREEIMTYFAYIQWFYWIYCVKQVLRNRRLRGNTWGIVSESHFLYSKGAHPRWMCAFADIALGLMETNEIHSATNAMLNALNPITLWFLTSLYLTRMFSYVPHIAAQNIEYEGRLKKASPYITPYTSKLPPSRL